MAEKPFKDREEVKREIEKFSAVGLFDSGLGVVFAIIGIITDALDTTLSWNQHLGSCWQFSSVYSVYGLL